MDPTLTPTEDPLPAGTIPRQASIFGRIPDLLIRAGRTGFWPLVDQGVVSAGNFLTLVLVARALPLRSDYGAFGLLLELIFYLNTLQGALITYPLTLKGAVADENRLRRLASAALLMTLVLTIPVAAIGLGIATLSQLPLLGLAGVFALVTWQVQEVVRKSLIAHFRYADAVWGDALRYLGTAAVIGVMWHFGRVTLVNVFLVIGACSGVAIVVQAIQLGLRPIAVRDILDLARQFWAAGHWLLLTSLTAVLISICGVWALSFFHGNDVVGEFYAVANFTKPINPIIATFGGLVLQYAAKAYDRHGIAGARRAALRISGIALLLILPYLLILLLLPGPALRLLYGANSHFSGSTSELVLRMVSVGFTLFVIMTLIGSFLNGIHRTRDSFLAQLVNSVVTIGLTLPLTIRYGLVGMMLGGLAAAAIQLLAMLHLFRRAT